MALIAVAAPLLVALLAVRFLPALVCRRPLGATAAPGAGLLAVLVFPPIALAHARRLPADVVVPPVPTAFAHRPMGTQD